MLTWSSLRLLAGIWTDVCVRWPVMVAVGWLRRPQRGGAVSTPVQYADREGGCSLIIPDPQKTERGESIQRFVAEHWGQGK